MPGSRSDRVDRLSLAVGKVNHSPFLRLLITWQQCARSADTLLISGDRGRICVGKQSGGRFVEHAARHHNRPVGRQQLFLAVILYRPHAFLQRGVLHGKAEYPRFSFCAWRSIR